MENRIKEQQLGLFSDRTSCHYWWPDQFRLLLSSCAYVLTRSALHPRRIRRSSRRSPIARRWLRLMEALRRLGLQSTELARAQLGTIRLKLLKIGAVITRDIGENAAKAAEWRPDAAGEVDFL